MTNTGKGDDDAELHARLARLEAALRHRDEEDSAKAETAAPKRSSFGRAMSLGLNAFSEFVGAIVVSALIGWQVDVWLGAKPWFLVLFLGLGTAAGFWNIYRLAAPKAPSGGEIADQAPEKPTPTDKRAGRTPPGEDDES
jgi:ATP synthase protein I